MAIYGTGEAAELAYLSITELGLELVAVFDGTDADLFLGHEVRPIEQHHEVAFDLLLVATLDRPAHHIDLMLGLGIARDRLVVLRPQE
jgi:hypothetical protein